MYHTVVSINTHLYSHFCDTSI